MDTKKLLKKLKTGITKELSVKNIYLFGSRATEKYEDDSDYDIAVVSNDFTGMSFMERQKLIRPLVRKAIGVKPIDVVCYTEKEYEDGKKAFLPKIIEEEGVAAT